MPLIRKPPDGSSPATEPFDAPAALQSAFAEARWTAARRLESGHCALVVAALARETDPRVREALFTALARDGSDEAIAAIMSFIRSQDAGVRTAALDALAILPGAVAAHIEALLSDPDRDVRILSCDLARRLPERRASLCLAALLERESDVNVCAAAVEVLSEAGDESARPALAACAARFVDDAFLTYAIGVALRRIAAGEENGAGVNAILPATDEEFRRLCEFLYRHTGMIFTETKRYYVERRILDRMAATESASFGAYFAYLRANSRETEHFINALTVNETYFYREEHQLRCLTTDLLRERLVVRRGGDPIRIWSNPCSTGEEAYSIAIWLLENWPEVDRHEIEIIGSDIDTRVLGEAADGRFGRRALMRLSADLISKYFVQEDEEHWRIIEDLRQSVQFVRANLVDPAGTRRHGRFDVIFCRNVLIYFDDGARRTAAENLFENLAPGGFLCLGHTESMSRISSLFEVCRYSDAIVYQRPNGNG